MILFYIYETKTASIIHGFVQMPLQGPTVLPIIIGEMEQKQSKLALLCVQI